MTDVKISELPAATSSTGVDLLVLVQGGVTKQISNTKLFTSTALTTPILGTPTSGTLTNCTGLPILAGTTGTLSVARGGTGVTGSTGTGSVVLNTSPILITPTLGAATATTVNKVTITQPATSATLTILNGKTLTVDNSLELIGTDGTTMTFPTTSAALARRDAAQTFSGDQTFGNIITSGTIATNAAAPTIASAATIAPTTHIVFVSGTTNIDTITAPAPISSGGGQITIIPTGLWTTTTAGNIALGTTAVVNKALIMTYDATTTKWYPSY